MAEEVLSPQPEAELWEEGLWDDLLAYIEEDRVIPIIGPDLLRVEVNGTPVRLERYVATGLARRLGLPPEELPEDPCLNDVICRFLRRRPNDRASAYVRIATLLREAPLEPPRPLLQLAGIRHFNLFVTTTFDTLLEEALNRVRFDGRRETRVIAYAPNKVQDLPCPREELDGPTVYHLLGRLSATSPYVICDEDMLEFVCALQSDNRRPEKLFDELQSNHLLVLGGNFSDWLARFFLRTAKRRRLSDSEKGLDFLADSKMRCDPGLAVFLRHFSSHTKVFQGGGALEFVDELWRRWSERHPDPAVAGPAPRPCPADLEGRVNWLARAFPAFAEDLRWAYEYRRSDPKGSVVKSRRILEALVGQTYAVAMGKVPRKPMLQEMLQDNQFTRRIERRIFARMKAIQEMGNIGAHPVGRVSAADATGAVEDLCEVLSWHQQEKGLP